MSEELKPCPCCKQISTVSHLQCSSCLGDRIIPDDESGGARTCSRCLGSGYVTRYSPTTDPELDRLRAENERLREELAQQADGCSVITGLLRTQSGAVAASLIAMLTFQESAARQALGEQP